MPIDKTKLTKEMLEKVVMCKTADELIALAKENGVELTVKQAEEVLDEIKDVELDEKTLDKIAGGKGVNMHDIGAFCKKSLGVLKRFGLIDEIDNP